MKVVESKSLDKVQNLRLRRLESPYLAQRIFCLHCQQKFKRCHSKLFFRRTISVHSSCFDFMLIYGSVSCKDIRTYIIGYYDPSVWITTQLLKTLVLYILILYMSGGIYPNNRFWRSFFMVTLFTLRVFARHLLFRFQWM